ncbi:MAG: cadherin-like domain-containing protein [Schleiferiaceae bacterium]|nr:cadherin-like domain-containing protein [Schleiferiaceae bacterium]
MKGLLLVSFMVFMFNGVSQMSNLPCNGLENTPIIPNNGFSGLSAQSGSTGLTTSPSNTARLIDNDLNNSVTVSAVLLASQWVQVSHNTEVYDAGTFAGFNVQATGLLGVLGNITITTYSATGTQLESLSGADLLLLGSSNRADVGFITTQPWSRVRFTTSAILSTQSYAVYYAVSGNKLCAGVPLVCNTPIPLARTDFAAEVVDARTGTSGLNVGTVANTDNLINGDPNSGASINFLLSVLGSASVSVRSAVNVFPAGSFTGFEFSSSNLLDVSVLGTIQVRTYLNGSLRENLAGTALLAGVGLLGTNGRSVVGLVTTQTFDEVRLTFNQPVNLNLGSITVFHAIVQEVCPAAALICNTRTSVTNPDFPFIIETTRTGVSGGVSAGTISNVNNILSDNSNDFASVSLLAGVLTTASISLKDPLTTYPTNTYVGFDIQNLTLLNANVLNNVQIRTFLNGVVQETVSGNATLIDVPLLSNSGRFNIGFVTSQVFDEVQLRITQSLDVNLGTTLIYGLEVMDVCPTTLVCEEAISLTQPETPAFVNFQNTGVSTACVGCALNDVDNVLIDGFDDFATLILTAGLLGSIQVAVKDPSLTYPSGSLAGFVVENMTGNLLVLDLLENLTITTYLNSNQVESRSAFALLDLDLLGILGTQQGGRRFVGFQTTSDFDEIQISFGGLVNAQVLTTMRVYFALVETSLATTSGGTTTLNCCPDFDVILGFNPSQTVHLGNTLPTISFSSSLKLQDALEFVYSPIALTDPSSVYDGMLDVLGTATADVTTEEVEFLLDPNFFNVPGQFFIYMRSALEPSDPTCRPFEGFELTLVNGLPDHNTASVNQTITGDLSANDFMPSTATYITIVADIGNPDGTLPILNSDGTYNFTATIPGLYFFETEVCATSETQSCGISTLKIIVFDGPSVSNPPFAVSDFSLAVGDDVNPNSVGVSVLANDQSSNDGGILNAPTIATAPVNGTAQIVGTTIEYTPNPGFYGKETFSYQVCELPSNLCDLATVTILVTAPNSPKFIVANDDFYTTNINTPIVSNASTGVLVNDVTNSGNPLVVTAKVESITGVGELDLNADGSFEFTPEPNFSGGAIFNYEVCDGVNCQTASILFFVSELPGVRLRVNVLLQGPYNSANQLMNDLLRSRGFIPLKEPYSAIPRFNRLGNEEVSASDSAIMFADYGAESVVDWILVELRSTADSTDVIATQSALVRRDGSVINTIGQTELFFEGLQPGDYFVSVRHRNHLGVMKKDRVELVGGAVPPLVDFTSDLSSLWGQFGANLAPNNSLLLWAGNAASSNRLVFQGPGDDPSSVFFNVLFSPDNQNLAPNFTSTFGYFLQDLNMDGTNIFQGPNNDIDVLFFNLLFFPLNSTLSPNFANFFEQIP